MYGITIRSHSVFLLTDSNGNKLLDLKTNGQCLLHPSYNEQTAVNIFKNIMFGNSPDVAWQPFIFYGFSSFLVQSLNYGNVEFSPEFNVQNSDPRVFEFWKSVTRIPKSSREPIVDIKCSCDIKDLLSVGHNIECMARK